MHNRDAAKEPSMSTASQVIEIIAQQALLAPGDVAMSATLPDLGIDSLGLVECIFAIEEEFDISIPFNANDPNDSQFDISTVATIITAVETLVRDQA